MQKTNKFQTGNAITIGYAHFVHDLYSAFLAPVLPLILERLQINYFLVGILTVIQRIPSFFMMFIGLLADRVRLRYLVIVTPLLTCVIMSTIGLAPNFMILAIMLFITGLSSAFFHVPTPVMMKKISGDKVGLGMSIYMVGGELSRTLGPLVILAAVSWWEFEGVYRLIPFGAFSSLFLFFRLRKIKISQEIVSQSKSALKDTIKSYFSLMMVIFGITFFRAIMKSSLTTFLPIYLNVKGESLWFAGISLSVLEFAGVFGTFFAGIISDFFGRKRLLFIVSVLTPVLMYLFVNSEGYITFPLLILMGFFIFATTPVILAIVMDNNSDRPSFINSMYMTISFVGSSVAALLVGFVADKIGIELTYEISAFIALGAIPFTLLLPEKSNTKQL